MIEAFIKRGDGRIIQEGTEEALREAVRDRGAVFWVDITRGTDEELGILDDVFGFHPLAIEDVISYVQRPKIESYMHTGDVLDQGYFYLVIHGPDVQTFKARLRTKELDVFLSERYLVTIHEDEMRSVGAMIERARADARVVLNQGLDMLLYQILDRLVDHYMPILDHMQEVLDELEERAVTQPEPQLLPEIAAAKKDLLTLRRIIGPQRDVMAQLTRGEVPFIKQETRVYLRDVLDHLNRAVETLELYRDLVLGARDIYMSSLSNNLNQVMKTLTIITVVALPLTVITSFFGMNFDAIPGLHSPAGFWVAVGVMVSFAIGLVFWFKRMRWL